MEYGKSEFPENFVFTENTCKSPFVLFCMLIRNHLIRRIFTWFYFFELRGRHPYINLSFAFLHVFPISIQQKTRTDPQNSAQCVWTPGSECVQNSTKWMTRKHPFSSLPSCAGSSDSKKSFCVVSLTCCKRLHYQGLSRKSTAVLLELFCQTWESWRPENDGIRWVGWGTNQGLAWRWSSW